MNLFENLQYCGSGNKPFIPNNNDMAWGFTSSDRSNHAKHPKYLLKSPYTSGYYQGVEVQNSKKNIPRQELFDVNQKMELPYPLREADMWLHRQEFTKGYDYIEFQDNQTWFSNIYNVNEWGVLQGSPALDYRVKAAAPSLEDVIPQNPNEVIINKLQELIDVSKGKSEVKPERFSEEQQRVAANEEKRQRDQELTQLAKQFDMNKDDEKALDEIIAQRNLGPADVIAILAKLTKVSKKKITQRVNRFELKPEDKNYEASLRNIFIDVLNEIRQEKAQRRKTV